MIRIEDAFADHYAHSRAKFLAAAAQAGLAVHAFFHPLKGQQGEDLAIDAVLDGAPDAPHLLVLSAGTQGIDLMAGSGLLVYALHDQEWRDKCRAQGVAVLYVHGVNPWGASYQHVADENGVCFLRNFLDFSQPLPSNKAYDQLHQYNIPETWPPDETTIAAMEVLVQRLGINQMMHIYRKGQFQHADGMYYGGTAPSWAHTQWRQLLRQYGAGRAHIAWVDLRTSWGIHGMAVRVAHAVEAQTQALARARRWWQPEGSLQPVHAADEVPAMSDNQLGNPSVSFAQECPQAQYTGLSLIFAVTDSLQTVADSMRARYWLAKYPEKADAARAQQIKTDLLKVKYSPSAHWQGLFISQGRQALFLAADGLAGLR